MNLRVFASASCSLLIVVSASAASKQLTGQHAPATTPALSPAEAGKKFKVPSGFEVRLFAAEPDVINPVAMTWDERGRLWVVELYEYPLGAAPGAKPRDRIKIIEDTDLDGKADKVTVFADGLNLATGILIGNGGVYVGQAPEFLFLQDTDGDDIADKRTVLLTGFGLHDRHELLNSFTWGPDGWLYMTHGVFTHSQVKDPLNPNAPEVKMDGAVARFHPRTKRFEVFADGTSNPWGVDFDRAGNAFVSACVIDHLFHLAPGGLYARQGGTPPHPYAYQLLPSIIDHNHFRAAYAGVNIYQGNQYPEPYRGKVFIGNIHQSAINLDRLTPNGSSFKASAEEDFLVANDGWFRPVSTQTGPDGALWIMDWYDKYPCYQNANADPDGVDRERGRVWRVVYTGDEKGKKIPPRPQANMNLLKASTTELVDLLSHPNVWQRRTAQRVLSERRDAVAKNPVASLLRTGQDLEARLAALWTLHASEQLDEATLDRFSNDKEPAIRAWVARLTGERRQGSEEAIERLKNLAQDSDPTVRLAVAVAARLFMSGSLTVNTSLPPGAQSAEMGEILATVALASASGKDPVIPFMIWMAGEPAFARDPDASLEWLVDNADDLMPLGGALARKAMRRLCDQSDARLMNKAAEFLAAAVDKNSGLAVAAMDGLIEGQKGKALVPSVDTQKLFARLAAHPDASVQERGQRLGTLWGDASALQKTLSLVNDAQASVEARRNAILVAKQLKSAPARQAMIQAVSESNSEPLQIESLRALGEIGGDDSVAQALVQKWKNFSPNLKRVGAEVLVSRPAWAKILLDAIEEKKVLAQDIPVTAIRTLAQSNNANVKGRAEQLIGRFRESDPDKMKLIAAKKRVVLSGTPDLEAGHDLARKSCLTCHKLHGEGAEVGPDLTGVGRSTLDALLANVIDPNQVIGKGYENVEVETRDGRAISGRLVENTQARIKLLSAGPKEDVIAKSEIASMRVSELSVMPEGLEQIPDADFRNLIWYILNPPQDNRPMTPQLRKELIGDERAADRSLLPLDRESVALWNPQWKVIAPDFDGTPRKLSEYRGRKNVLVTHPFDESEPAALERTLWIADGQTRLHVMVASDEGGDWEFRAFLAGKLAFRRMIGPGGTAWKEIDLDLSPYSGKSVQVRLENFSRAGSGEFGYWGEIQLVPATGAVAVK